MGVKEAWGGVAWASLGGAVSPACQSLLQHLTRLSSKPRQAPHSPCGQSRHLGNGQWGQAEACPPQENQYCVHLPGPRKSSLECLPQGKKERGRVQVRGMSAPSCWEKVLEGGRSSHTHTEAFPPPPPTCVCVCMHMHMHTLTLWLITGDSHSNPGSWGLREGARG